MAIAPERSDDGMSAAQRLAKRQATGTGPPALLDSYKAVPTLEDWFEGVRDYFLDPDPDQERAADWILDNDYQIKRALRRLREGMPRDFYNRLPSITAPGAARIPRIFCLSQAVYGAIAPQITLSGLTSFIDDYQDAAYLTNAELWAMPSMLRLVCIERFIKAVSTLNPALMPPLTLSAETLEANQSNPVEQIAAAITNLIVVETIKWPDFVDATSRIEAKLSQDPAEVYARMTFEARNSYRDEVEKLAWRSDCSEDEIARMAVDLALKEDSGSPQHHVGYWLISEGLATLEKEAKGRVSIGLALQRRLLRYRGWLYAAGLSALVLAAITVSVFYLWRLGATPAQWIMGIALSLLPATIPSIWFGHWVITSFSRPQTLPEMDFSKSIPPEFATAVVLPVIIGAEAEVDQIIEKLEVLRLANKDPAFRFVLLSDPADAQTETTEQDQAIEAALLTRIDELNSRYPAEDGGPFFLLHRHRTYNHSEGCWMAWERKRGKLEEFNRFVLGDDTGAFSVVAGPVTDLRGMRYAITLDADTQLPPGTAARMVGVLAHPLNRPVFDPKTRRIARGHAILQPRIEILPKLGKGTHFTHLYGGDTAVDIYSRAVSNVYQDLFGTGIYVGKGIYDIAALQRSMSDRVPDNTVLSHDLFEGLHGRAALVSNLVLYEDLPATYPEYALRQHRWMRGDWQLVPWLGGKVPSAHGGRTPSSLSPLDRWKMLDNLRRSLTPPALLLFFLGAWLILPGSALVWTILAVAAPGSYLIGELFAIATGGIRKGALGNAVHKIRATGGRWFFSIVFLVSDTLMALDAILRTLWRVYVSGRKRLEWTSAAHASSRMAQGSIRRTSWLLMWPSSALALVIGAHLALTDPVGILPAVPVLLLWFIAPEVSVWSARPRYFRSQTLNAAQRHYLLLVARRTWHFFETFVGPDDNWLPPDNYQFGSKEEIAHRTSPTNIGMFLVSALAARDLGFITTNDFQTRCRNTIATIDKITGYRGHILNWYHTQTLEPLQPQYISTVDSGNLAVALITLKQGCLDMASRPALARDCFECIDTTLDLLCEAISATPEHDATALSRTDQKIRGMTARAAASPLEWPALHAELIGPVFQELETHALKVIEGSPDLPEQAISDITTWLERYRHDIHAIAREINTFAPWLSIIADAPSDDVSDAIERGLQKAAKDTGAAFPTGAVASVVNEWQAAHNVADAAVLAWLDRLRDAANAGLAQQDNLRDALRDLADKADQIAYGMDFAFLYDPAVRLFSIGYNLSLGKMDHSHYDLLATEARLASYFAIAKHDAPIEHWFALSRPITRLQGKPSILSWNGSMFEYLMPPLFLPSYHDTLLGESELTAVDFQRDYASARGVPWGISESAFGTTDAQGTFQYRAFGVPGLGIRRGLTEDLVIAPYGTALALCGWPEAATDNLQFLDKLGALTRFGFIEALDFTPDRAAPGRDHVPVTTFMAHHQGMVQMAITNALRDDIMVRRFLTEKSVRAMDLLLQERVPWDAPLELGRADERWEREQGTHPAPDLAPWVPSEELAVPQVHFLGNGRISSLLTDSGGGGLFLRDTALTRWRPDPSRSADGIWLYLQDTATQDLWSLGSAPTGRDEAETKCVFHQHMVELLRRHDGIVARMEVTVAPYDDVEIRHITLVNEGDQTRTLDLTTYAEVVLAPPMDDERHPAFSKLFVHSTYLPEDKALLFRRRPRRPEIQPPVLLHKLVADDPEITIIAWETDRLHFLGRNQSTRSPQALRSGLPGTTGWTLDPVMAMQVRVRLKPMESRHILLLNVAGTSRAEALQIARRYPLATIDRTFRDALFESARAVSKLDLPPEHLPELQVLSSLLVHVHQSLRAPAPDGTEVWNGQQELWRFGISGDFPILMLTVSEPDNSSLLDILVRGHRLWRSVGLKVDFVIMRDAATSYEEPLREKILSILGDSNATTLLGMRGGIHLIAADQVSPTLRRWMEAAAHVVLHDDRKPLRDKLDRALEIHEQSPAFLPGPSIAYAELPDVDKHDNLQFDNGYGGFDPETGDYVIHLTPGTHTPAPWCNILANDEFGCMVSESGFGATWAGNSGEHRLTPWSNDPVTDLPVEAVYFRDEGNGDLWTATPQPMGQQATCDIRHGAGFTTWRQNSHGLEQETTCFVPVDAPVKLVRLRLRNGSGQPRRISATYYAQWLLGALESVARPHIVTRYDAAQKAIIGRNHWNPEFSGRAAFLTASIEPHSVTGDRRDFLGRDGDVTDPDGLRRWDLGGRFPQGGDACAAYQVHLDLAVNETAEVVFALGEVPDEASLSSAIARWKSPDEVDKAFTTLRATWAKRLGAVQVRTPDPAFDLMVNRWLPYQNRSCRIMARAGFYQAGGAYGFRDQLQDMLALLHSDPGRVKEHIILAAQFQFEAGDVLHWWHPPDGRGVRTRCSDDYLWLPYVTARYVQATGDGSVLESTAAFLRAEELQPGEHDRYALFERGETGTIFDHCARALDLMMTTGAHDLPLIGGGDWNDGMDRIGEKGRGESIWLAWFQIATVRLFAPLARKTGQDDRAERWERHATNLQSALSKNAWDGNWYLRAYDDAGLPWGSATNDECQIDLIAQAWSVLSGLPPDDRARQAMQSANDRLVDHPGRLIRLLTPPFDATDRDPGYIRAYPPGIRENGGQYTHAAAWMGMAHAIMKDGDQAYQAFDIISPIRRTADRQSANHYRREPYVLAGDVSDVGARTGQGGWSWYTGAAGWTWQLGVAGILGVHLEGGQIRLDPCLPKDWAEASVTLEGKDGRIEIMIEKTEHEGSGETRITVDGSAQDSAVVAFPGPGKTCQVVVRTGVIAGTD